MALTDGRTACSGFGGGIRNDVAALDTFTLAISKTLSPIEKTFKHDNRAQTSHV